MSVRPSERPQMHFPLDGRRKQLDRGEPTWSVNDGRNEGESTRNGAEKVVNLREDIQIHGVFVHVYVWVYLTVYVSVPLRVRLRVRAVESKALVKLKH